MTPAVVINSLRLEGFGCFEDRSFSFGPGINQLVGPNESGKSTVLRGIVTALFTPAIAPDQKSASQPCPDRGRLILRFKADETDYVLTRDYRHGINSLTDSAGREYDDDETARIIGSLFIAEDAARYKAIFYIDRETLDDAYQQGNLLKALIEKPLLGNFDRAKADDELAERIGEIESPDEQAPGRLERVGQQLSKYIQEKTRMDDEVSYLRKINTELIEIRRELQENTRDISRLEEDIKGAETYHDLIKRMDEFNVRLQEHLSRYSRAGQLNDDLERIETVLSRLKVPDQNARQAMAEKVEGLKEPVEEAKQVMDRRIIIRNRARHEAAAASLLLLILGLTHFLQENLNLAMGRAGEYLPYVIGAATIIWMFQAAGYIAQQWRKRKATAYFRSRLAELDAYYDQINKEYSLGAADPIFALEEAARHKENLETSAESLRTTINHLSEGQGMKYLAEIKNRLESEIAQLNAALSPVTKYAGMVETLPRSREELIARYVRVKALAEREAALDPLVRQLEGCEKEAARIDGEIAELKSHYSEMNNRLEILKITRVALNRAVDRLIEEGLENFGQAATRFFREITGRGTSGIRFSQEKTAMEFRVESQHGWQSEWGTASGSTCEAVSMAVRLGAMKSLAVCGGPPLLIDDLRLLFDLNRASRWEAILSRLAKEKQIIMAATETIENLSSERSIECECTVSPAGITA